MIGDSRKPIEFGFDVRQVLIFAPWVIIIILLFLVLTHVATVQPQSFEFGHLESATASQYLVLGDVFVEYDNVFVVQIENCTIFFDFTQTAGYQF